MNNLLSALRQRPWWQKVAGLVLLASLYLHLCGLAGARVLAPALGWGAGVPPNVAQPASLAGWFARWDAGFYLAIAADGYRPNAPETAFFPLYSLVIRFVAATGLPLAWAALLVSQLCFIGIGLLLYQWAALEFGPGPALWAVVWLCAFPMAFFFLAPYAEGLFLLLSVAALLCLRRGWFFWAGLCIALAGAARPVGFLLAVPFVVEFWQQRDFRPRCLAAFVAGGLVAPLGLLAYFAYLARLAGTANLLAPYLSMQAADFERRTVWPWVALWQGLRAAVFGHGINADWFSRALAWHDLAFALLGLALTVWAVRRLPRSAGLFLAAGMLFITTQHGAAGYAMWSWPRYLLALIPVYLALACLTVRLPARWRWLPPVLSAGWLGLLAAWFASGRWVA